MGPEIHVILKVRTAKTSLYPSKPKQKKISKNGIEIEFLSEVMHRNSVRTSWVFYPVGEDISEESMKRYQAFFQPPASLDEKFGKRLSKKDWSKGFGEQAKTTTNAL